VTLSRSCRPLLLPVLLSLPLLTVVGPAGAAPASKEDMNFYGRFAALNICVARAAGVPFDKAVPVAAETVAQVLKAKHGSKIKSLGSKALTIKELRSGSATSAVIGAVEKCPKLIPADVVANVKKLLQSKPPGGIPAPAAPQ